MKLFDTLKNIWKIEELKTRILKMCIRDRPYAIAKEALRLAAQKLPIATKFVVRRDYTE